MLARAGTQTLDSLARCLLGAISWVLVLNLFAWVCMFGVGWWGCRVGGCLDWKVWVLISGDHARTVMTMRTMTIFISLFLDTVDHLLSLGYRSLDLFYFTNFPGS